jgi:hypothetical protein
MCANRPIGLIGGRVVHCADRSTPLLLPGLDEDVGREVERLRRIAADEGRDPASLPVPGRVYLGDSWQREVERALELGFSHLTATQHRLQATYAREELRRQADLAVEELDKASRALSRARSALPSNVTEGERRFAQT